MFQATLLVINGANRGSRFELNSGRDFLIGRSVGCDIRLDDSEVSRHHARVTHNGNTFLLTDLHSANGTRVNSQLQAEYLLQHGDTLQLGNSVLSFQLLHSSTAQTPPTAAEVRFVEDPEELSQASILQLLPLDDSVPSSDNSATLDLMYHVAEELVAPVLTSEIRLQRILQLTLDAVGADHGCFLLRNEDDSELQAVAFARSEKTDAGNDQMLISRSITSCVLRDGTALRTSNAGADERFATGQSIVSEGIREAVCAPLRGRASLLGVLYLDTRIPAEDSITMNSGRLTDEHLRMVVTVARQTALAMESRQFQDAMVRAERFAAMGQTITVLSHHIKNILQGVRGGGHLIHSGLEQQDSDLIRSGWNIVERNQNRIYDLVMDMLSFSRDRVPVLKSADLNALVAEVTELSAGRADEAGVSLEFRPGDRIPEAQFDSEGIHRAALNIVANAIDAAAETEAEAGAVIIQTGYDIQTDVMLLAISDNGPGIPPELRKSIFNVFESSKGSRGTGIGLAVSRKILREHGGRIQVEGEPGEGTRFVLSWPRGTAGVSSPTLNLPQQPQG